jgi:hypothetical protein
MFAEGCAMACLVMEAMPLLGKGVFTVGSFPRWHCLDTCSTFMEKMSILLECQEEGVSVDLSCVLDVVHDIFLENKEWDSSLLTMVFFPDFDHVSPSSKTSIRLINPSQYFYPFQNKYKSLEKQIQFV